MRETIVRTQDGRDLQVLEAGDLDGFPIFVHHGTPGCRLLYPGTVEDAAARGIRLLSHDRPGYGRSMRHRRRRVVDVAGDVRAICDELGIERFGSWGFSGGGPHALACGARLEDRCVAVASLAAIGPYGADGLDFFAGMGEENVAGFKQTLDGEDAIRPETEEQRAQMMSGDPEDIINSIRTLLAPVDEAVFRGAAADYLVKWMLGGMGDGADGWIDDDLVLMSPWGFDVREIAVPVSIWHGRHDRFVGINHAEWFVGRIPNAESRLSESDGHLTLLTDRIPEVHQWLLDHA